MKEWTLLCLELPTQPQSCWIELVDPQLSLWAKTSMLPMTLPPEGLQPLPTE
jgi:hypothetical protein